MNCASCGSQSYPVGLLATAKNDMRGRLRRLLCFIITYDGLSLVLQPDDKMISSAPLSCLCLVGRTWSGLALVLQPDDEIRCPALRLGASASSAGRGLDFHWYYNQMME